MDYQNEYLQKNPSLHTEDAPIKFAELKSELDKLPQTSSFIDVGCGAGLVTNSVFQHLHSKKAIGLDISEAMIQAARRLNRHPNITFICQDIFKYHPKSQFDAVICTDIIEHIPNDTAFIKALLRLSQTLIIRVPLEDSLLNKLLKKLGISDELAKTQTKYGHIHHYGLSSFIGMVDSADAHVESYTLHTINKARSWWLNEILRWLCIFLAKFSLPQSVIIGGGFLTTTIKPKIKK